VTPAGEPRAPIHADWDLRLRPGHEVVQDLPDLLLALPATDQCELAVAATVGVDVAAHDRETNRARDLGKGFVRR